MKRKRFLKYLEMPLVTVIVPCFNHEKYVQNCIRSIIEQDYDKIELIIIDDGSKDGSVEKIQEIIPACEKRFVRFEFRSRPNKGVATTLNEAIEWADGDYLSAIASDDLLHEKKISLIMNIFCSLDENYAAVFADASFIDSDGRQIYLDKNTGTIGSSKDIDSTSSFLEYFTHKRKFQYKDPNKFGSYASLLEGNYLPAMGGVLRTNYVRKVNNFSSGVMIEDWDLWLKLTRSYVFYFVPSVVSYYRLHGLNTFVISSEKLLKDSLCLLKREELYAKEHGFSVPFYSRKATSILGLIKLNPFNFIRHIRDFLDYKFLLAVIRVIHRKIKNV